MESRQQDLEASTHAIAGAGATDSPVLHPYYGLLPPYITSAAVDAERVDLLLRIQESLACLQVLHDAGMGPRLQKRYFRDVDTFFKLKHQFPVDLHAQLINVLMELLWVSGARAFTDVDMEIRAVKTLQLLLGKWKKRHDIAPEHELAIDWKIVKCAVERVCFSMPGCVQRASQALLSQLATATVKCGEEARHFFRATGPAVPFVAELWAEFGATIKDVHSTDCFKALAFFSFFVVFPDDGEGDAGGQEKVAEGLLREWFDTWALISRCSEWDGHWIKILSRVAKKFPSTRMWDSYLPLLFAKVHDQLELPSDLGSPFKKNLWPSVYSCINGSKRFGQHAMRLCVYLLRNAEGDETEGRANDYLLEILSMMKPFFHPSNVANVGNALGVYVFYLSNALGKRLGSEKGRRATGETAATAGDLTLASCHGIVDALLEICLLGVYSKNRGVATKCMFVLQNLVCIDPAHCTAPVLQEMLKALDPMAMSHSHLASTAISSLSAFLSHLVCGRHPQSTGRVFSAYLEPILKLTLPGIDANDEKKTQSTVKLYFQLLSWLPLVNDPAKANFLVTKQRGDASNRLFAAMESSQFADIAPLDDDTDQQMWELGSFLEEWTFALLDRCFQFIQSRMESASTSGSRSGGQQSHGKAGDEDAIVLQVLNLMAIVYAQMSPEIYEQALRKTSAFVENAFFTTPFGGEVVSTLIFNCMQGNPSKAIAQFMPLALEKLCATKKGVDVSSLMMNEKVWHLRVLDGIVRFSSPDDRILLIYRDELTVLLAHFLNSEDEKEVCDAAADVLHNLLAGLLGTYTHDFRSLPSDQWTDATSPKSGAFQYLGASISWNNLSVAWHEPNEDEFAFGMELLQAHVIEVLDELEGMQSKKDLTVRLWARRLKQVLQALQGASGVLVDDTEVSGGALRSGAMPLLTKALGGNAELLSKYVALKGVLMKRIHGIVVFWREDGSGSAMDTKIWRELLAIMNTLLIWRGDHLDVFALKEKQNMYLQATSLDIASRVMRRSRSAVRHTLKSEEVPLMSRNEMVEKVLFFYSKRKVQEHFALANAIFQQEGGSGVRELYESLLLEVDTLLKSPYDDVRGDAVVVMKECSTLYTGWLYSRLLVLVDELEGYGSGSSTEVKEEAVLGVLHTLALPVARRQMWKKRDRLLKRVLLVLLKSNDTIVKKVDGEASKAKVGLKLQTFFLSVLSAWRYVEGEKMSPPLLQELVAAEPAASEHWKFQLMHLVMLYPFLQSEQMPISLDVWHLVVRQLKHEVLPVRQVAVVLYAQLLKLLKRWKAEGGAGTAKDAEELIYAEETMRALVNAFVSNNKGSNRFAASADSQHAESAPSDWSFGVSELVRYISSSTHAYPKAPPLSAVRLLNQSSDTFSSVGLSGAKLVQRLVQINAKAFFESGVESILSALAAEKIGAEVAEEDRQAALKTLAEWTAALLHALLKTETLDEQEVAHQMTAVVKLLMTILPHLSVVLVDQWVQVMYLSSRPSRSGAVKLGRLEPLVAYLLQELEDSFIRATAEDYARQAKWLALVEAVAIHVLAAGDIASDGSVRTLASQQSERVLRVIREHALTHQYKIIRDRAGKMLFLLGTFGLAPSSTLIPASALPLNQLVSSSAIAGDNADEGKGDSAEKDVESATSLHAKETAMQWLSCCEKHGGTQEVLAVLNQLLPVTLLSQHHPKAEVAVQAKNTTNAVSSSLRMFFVPQDAMGEQEMESLFALLERLSTSQVWKTRGAVLRFIMTFAFYHWVFFSAEWKQRVHALVSGFLTDDQREVQAMAKYALRGLIHNEPPAAVKARSVGFLEAAQEARTKFPKLQRRCQRLEAEDATEEELEKARGRLKVVEDKMTRSVLGLSAIVLAFPHDVPLFVPPMFEELGRFLYLRGRSSSSVSYLEKAVKETLLDFKRTHQDNWAETKSKFSRVQLDVIEDVVIAPNYFS